MIARLFRYSEIKSSGAILNSVPPYKMYEYIPKRLHQLRKAQFDTKKGKKQGQKGVFQQI